MDEYALMITMDIEGRLFIEGIVPPEFVERLDDRRTQVRLPVPRTLATKIGTALIEADIAAAATWGPASQSN